MFCFKSEESNKVGIGRLQMDGTVNVLILYEMAIIYTRGMRYQLNFTVSGCRQSM